MTPQRYTDDPSSSDTHLEDGNALGSYHDDPASDDETLTPPSTSHSFRPDLDPSRKPSLWSRGIQPRLPPRLARTSTAIATWVRGPQPPRIYRITPIFASIQTIPIKLLDRYLPKRPARLALLCATLAAWLLAFALIQHRSAFAAEVRGHGAPTRLSCQAHYWSDANGCGLNGDGCRPFANASMAFRCPANCQAAMVYEGHPVGRDELRYQNVVVGGEDGVYRGDSWICGAAVHAGFVGNAAGGCGVLELVGEREGFGAATKSHGVQSLGFDSYFPMAFRFVEGTAQQCKDLRWPVLIVSAVFTGLVAVFTTSPAVFFWSSFTIMFATVGLATDPPSLTDNFTLVSIAMGRFLPGCFCMAIMYHFAIRRSLTGLTAQLEKAVLWLGPAWIGALNNFTFEYIPIHRLTPHDVRAQPGGVIALIIVVLAIFFIALGQAWCFRVEGRMPRYLALYAGMGAGLLLLIAVPKMNVRIHHYILGLLLLPGTSFQTRPSLVYQGLLVGLFVNGVARWGFAPLLETSSALFSDINLGSLLPPIAAPVIGALGNNITFTLGPLPTKPDHGRTYDGISVLVNDVERLRSYADDALHGSWHHGAREWTWTRQHAGLPEYFRFAYMMGSATADYTKAGTWRGDGVWVQMDEGASG